MSTALKGPGPIKRLRMAIARAFKSAFRKAAVFFYRRWARRNALAIGALKLVASLGSAALTVYVLDYFLPVWLTLAIASTVFVHEMGHYITAKRLKRNVDPPIFLPFIWGVIGGTRLHQRGSNPDTDAQISLAGPTWGFVWALSGAAFAMYFKQNSIMWAFLWLAAFNLWHGTLGSDGKFFQTMKKQQLPEVGDEIYEHFAGATPPPV